MHENQPIIPDWLFEECSKVLFKLPYWPRIEHNVKRFIDRTESSTGGKIMLTVLWSTRNIKSFFPLKDEVVHQFCIIYERQCFCILTLSCIVLFQDNILKS